jgi:hypothetical protein
MEELLEKYKDLAFDPKQPFAMQVYHLYKMYPNDKDLGGHVRKLVLKMEKHLRTKAEEKNRQDLDKILNHGK